MGLSCNGEHIWPLLRHQLAAEYMGAGKTNVGPAGVVMRGWLLVSGFFYVCLLLGQFILSGRGIKYLFVSKASYRTRLSGYWFDRFCDSMIEGVGEPLKGNSVIFEGASGISYRKPRATRVPLFPLQGVYYLVSRFSFVTNLIRPQVTDWVLYDTVVSELTKLLKYPFKTDRLEFQKRLARIFTFSRLFFFLLKKTKIRTVFFVCYYDDQSYGLTLAAKRLGIKTIDLQHGVQGKFHFAYSPFLFYPKNGYNVVPAEFWVWDERAHANIVNWKTPNHQPFISGNVWLKYYTNLPNGCLAVHESGKINILFTAQPVNEPVPKHVINLILATIDKCRWRIRLHPRQLGQKARIAELVTQNNLLNHVEIEQASELPLPEVLNWCSVHVTLFSSVVFEAEHFLIPSVVLDPVGRSLYFGENRGYFYFPDAGVDVGELIITLAGRRIRMDYLHVSPVSFSQLRERIV